MALHHTTTFGHSNDQAVRPDQGMSVIDVEQGDITAQDTVAVVTEADESLMGGGGVDGATHRAVGPRRAQAGAAVGPCPPGDATATPASDLGPRVRHVMHTVGPVWEGGDQGEAEVLASCYRRCPEVADEPGAASVAFPAIATGVHGHPAEEAAGIAVAVRRSTPTGVRGITLVAFDTATHDLLAAALRSWRRRAPSRRVSRAAAGPRRRGVRSARRPRTGA